MTTDENVSPGADPAPTPEQPRINEPMALALALRTAGIAADNDEQIHAVIESLHRNRWYLRFEAQARPEQDEAVWLLRELNEAAVHAAWEFKGAEATEAHSRLWNVTTRVNNFLATPPPAEQDEVPDAPEEMDTVQGREAWEAGYAAALASPPPVPAASVPAPEQEEAVRLADAVLEANRRWPNETRWASLHREAFVSGAEWAGAALATPPPATPAALNDWETGLDKMAVVRRIPEAELSALDDWKWYGDWPERSHGAGDGWMHVHPDNTRWVHPKKSCQLVSEQH